MCITPLENNVYKKKYSIRFFVSIMYETTVSSRKDTVHCQHFYTGSNVFKQLRPCVCISWVEAIYECYLVIY